MGMDASFKIFLRVEKDGEPIFEETLTESFPEQLLDRYGSVDSEKVGVEFEPFFQCEEHVGVGVGVKFWDWDDDAFELDLLKLHQEVETLKAKVQRIFDEHNIGFSLRLVGFCNYD